MLRDTLHTMLLPLVTPLCRQLIPARLNADAGTISTVNTNCVVFSDATRVTSVVFVTASVMIVNGACVAPCGTTTVAGNVMGIFVVVGVAGSVNIAVS
jgi:hypothetical protein